MRLPLVPTILVSLAVAAMIGLGLWQLLDRLPQKEAFLAQLQTNPAKPVIPFPQDSDDSLLFRRTTGTCIRPLTQRLTGAGAAGYRVIADCVAGGGAARMPVQLGTTRNPNFVSAWRGGPVTGYISHAPSSQSLIGTLFHHQSKPLMLIADMPPEGLTRNGAPDFNSVPNNHLAYAVQWFFFAAIAAVIYLLAGGRRNGMRD